jgi:hypothetical protein
VPICLRNRFQIRLHGNPIRLNSDNAISTESSHEIETSRKSPPWFGWAKL